MPKVVATQTATTEVTLTPRVQRKLLTELEGYQALHTEAKACQAGADGHRTTVFALADAEVEADKFTIEGFKVAMVRGARDKRLDKQALIKRLVKDGKYSAKAAVALLDDCTSDKPKKDHVRITCPGESDDE